MSYCWPVAVKIAFYFYCFILASGVIMGLVALVGMIMEVWKKETTKS